MSRKILNPFNQTHKAKSHNCFGCSPYNSAGLKLEFIDFVDYIEALWKSQKQFEGFNNVLHGGIQSTLLDEIAAWVVFTKCETSGVTQNLQVQFYAPVYMNLSPIRIVGRLLEIKGKHAIIKTELFNNENKLCAEANIDYYLFPEAVARRKYAYPGLEAFYGTD